MNNYIIFTFILLSIYYNNKSNKNNNHNKNICNSFQNRKSSHQQKLNFHFLYRNKKQKQITHKFIQKIFSGANRTYLLNEQCILTWGEIVYPEQGQGSIQERRENDAQDNQSWISSVQQLKGQYFNIIPAKAEQLALGGNHTFAYTTTIKNIPDTSNVYQNNQDNKNPSSLSSFANTLHINTVYCWGSNINYQLGILLYNKNYVIGLQEEKVYSLAKLSLFDEAFNTGFNLQQISCGQAHSITILKDEQSNDTKIFGWGESRSYQLALDTNGIIPYPVQIQNIFQGDIQQMYSNSDYNMVLLKNGQVYSWGCNMFNRLGINVSSSKAVENKINMIKMENSQIFQNENQSNQGTDRSSQINHQMNNQIHNHQINHQIVGQDCKIPRRIQLSYKITKLSLGNYHVLAIQSCGSALSWGNGINGQLGNNKYGEFGPQRISKHHLTGQIRFISCSAGQQHSILLDHQFNVYTCGSNSFGVLGHNKHENVTKKKRCKIFQKVQFFQDHRVRIKNVQSGNRHVICLTGDNQLYGWGCNKNRQVKGFIDQGKVEKFVQNYKKFNNFYSNSNNNKYTYNYTNDKTKNSNNTISPTIKNNPSMLTVENRIQTLLQQQLKIAYNNINPKSQQFAQSIPQYLQSHIQQPNIQLISQINEWKINYKNFIQTKRKQQDRLLLDLQARIAKYMMKQQ